MLTKFRIWWEGADKVQRSVTIGGVFALMLLIAAIVLFSRPRMDMLYGNLPESEKAAIVGELQARGIPVKYDKVGTVEVPSDRFAEARMVLAGAGKAPKGAHMGVEGYDKLTLLSTPLAERNRIRAILESELARSIETVDGVESAVVHLNLAERSLFVDQAKPATASVKITEKSGSRLSPDQGRAIATLVANAVENMDVKAVSVVNQRLEFVFNGPDMNNTTSAADTRLEIERAVSEERERRLTQVLEGVFGPNSVYVMVHPNVALDEESSVTTVRTPTKVLERTRVSEQMTGGAGANRPAGAATNANVVGTAPATPGGPNGGSNYDVSKGQEKFAVNEEVKNRKNAVGELRGLMINVVANQAKVSTPELTQQLQSIVRGEIMNQADQLAFQVNVTVVPFDTTADVAAKRDAATAANAARINQLISMLPIVALLLVAFVVIKSLGKMAKSLNPSPTLATPEGMMMPLPDSPDALPGGSVSHGPTGHTASAGMTGTAGTSVSGHAGPSLAMSAQIPGQPGAFGGGTQLMAVLQGSPHEEMSPEIAAIQDRINMPLEQIKKMADEKPQMVGQIIKSMLLEDRR